MDQQVTKRNTMKNFLKFLLLILIILLNFTACQNTSKKDHNVTTVTKTQKALVSPIDYTVKKNWAYYGIGDNKKADLFIVCPTVDMGSNGNYNMSMDDEKTKQNYVGALNMERGIYENVTTLYAPYYRQASFPVYSMTQKDAEQYMELAYSDVRKAFLQYIKDTPKDRPFVLAGFSQGSDMVIRLLKEFFKDPAYQKRLVAAYCIGWRVTAEDIIECPWLKMAKGKDDLGTIIAFNSEAINVTGSLLVPAGVKTYSINPLNWKTDSTLAKASDNKGACFTDYTGAIKLETPSLTGAYIDEKRGTLKVPDIKPSDYSNILFPDGVYHLFDYQFFYRNLQENVSLRVARFYQK